jgi:hypothetical protein
VPGLAGICLDVRLAPCCLLALHSLSFYITILVLSLILFTNQ